MYKPNEWKNHIVQYRHRYLITKGEADGLVYLTPSPGEIEQQGTPQNAENFNHIEEGVFQDSKTLDKHVKNENIHITEEERENWNEDTGEKEITFSQATSREHLTSGEKLKISLGKIKKYFSDLKTVAFSGSYNDLSDTPTIPSTVRVKGNAESAYRVGNVNLTPENIGAAPSHVITNGNFNDIVIPGLYTIKGVSTNAPTSSTYHSLIVLNSDTDGYVHQIAARGDTTEVYIRTGSSFSWSYWNRLLKTGDLDTYLTNTSSTSNNTISFTSADTASPTSWVNVSLLTSGEKHSSIFNKISTMFKNMRYFYQMLGTTSISSIGNGTVTGAISSLNNNLSTWETLSISETYSGFKYTGGLMKYHPTLKLAFISVTIQATVATTTGVKIDMCKFNKVPSVNTALSARSPNTAGQAINVAIFTDGTLSLSTDKAIPKDGYILCSGMYSFT